MTTAGRRGRRPDPTVDAAIRQAVVTLLFERGFEMTFDEVAARAGVGRASVFRRFPTKRDMILDTIGQMTVGRIHPPDTGSLAGDLNAVVTDVMRMFGEPRMRGFARRFLGAAAQDPAFSDLFRANMARRDEMIKAVLARGIERGELPASTNPTLVGDLLSGILAFRLISDQPLPGPGEIRDLVDGFLYGFALRPRAAGRGGPHREPDRPESARR